MIGRIAVVDEQKAGSELSAAASIGASTLYVEDDLDFEDLGQLEIGGETFTYGLVADDTLAIDGTLASSYGIGERVILSPETIDRMAEVMPEDADESVAARVPHQLHDKLHLGTRGAGEEEAVLCGVDEEGDVVVRDVLGIAPVIDSDFLDELPPGTPGATGSTGTDGRDAGFKYAWNSTTDATTPTNGRIKRNTTPWSAVDKLWINETDDEGVDLTTVIDSWDDSTTDADRSRIELREIGNPGNAVFFVIVGPNDASPADYVKLSVSHVSGSPTFTSGMTLKLLVTRTGNLGAIGPTGAQGITGPTGAIGPTGVQGITGAQGITGVQGLTGNTGAVGPTGVQGIQGITGVQGPQGITGVQGPQGTQGITGVQGVQGVTGVQGVQGNPGIVGATGVVGPQGITGVQGPQGTQGVTGVQGAQGVTGVQGVQGLIGPTGSTGVQGPVGPTGIQGVQGLLGNTGAQGIQGAQGVTGVQGPQGTVGATGTAGVTGAIGPSGVVGPTGAVGATVFTLTARGSGTVPTPNSIGKGGSTGVWDSSVYSIESYVRGAWVSFRPAQTNSAFVIGLDSAPASRTLANFQDIDYGWYCKSDATLSFIEGGTTVAEGSAYTTSTVLSIVYDGANVRYYKDGVLKRTTARAIGSGLFFDSAMFTTDASLATEIIFSPMGEQGPTGAVGPTGPTGVQGIGGPTGPTGVQGPQGVAGNTGAQGSVGPTGTQGVQGNIGPTGATGVQGVVGPTGATGTQGPQGVAGVTGAQGTTGPTGVQGPQGNAGNTGAQGAVGFTGAQGIQGNQGVAGVTGAGGPIGPTGVQGPQGNAGNTGAQGNQGIQGVQGITGATGVQGAIGPTGPTGAQGACGPTGAAGSVGPTGPSGRPVRVASTANVVLATGAENGDVIDGVTLATGDRILLKDNSTASENGIYNVNASGAPTRASDASSGTDFRSASLVVVSEGTVNGDTMWELATNGAITIGTTGLAFRMLGGLTRYAAIAASCTSTSASAADPTTGTAGPSVTVPISSADDMIFIYAQCDISNSGANTSDVSIEYSSGFGSANHRIMRNTVAANGTFATTPGTAAGTNLSIGLLLGGPLGIRAGDMTGGGVFNLVFKLLYSRSAGTATFANRELTATVVSAAQL